MKTIPALFSVLTLLIIFLIADHETQAAETKMISHALNQQKVIIVVKKGDSFWKLSQKYHVSWKKLQKINAGNLRHRGNFNLIYPGQKIFLSENNSFKEEQIKQGFVLELKKASKVAPLENMAICKKMKLQILPKSEKISTHDVYSIFKLDKFAMIFNYAKAVFILCAYLIFSLVFALLVSFWYHKKKPKQKRIFIGYAPFEKKFCFSFVECNGLFVLEDDLEVLAATIVNEEVQSLEQITFRIPRRMKKSCEPLIGMQITDFKAFFINARNINARNQLCKTKNS